MDFYKNDAIISVDQIYRWHIFSLEWLILFCVADLVNVWNLGDSFIAKPSTPYFVYLQTGSSFLCRTPETLFILKNLIISMNTYTDVYFSSCQQNIRSTLCIFAISLSISKFFVCFLYKSNYTKLQILSHTIIPIEGALFFTCLINVMKARLILDMKLIYVCQLTSAIMVFTLFNVYFTSYVLGLLHTNNSAISF